MRTDVPGPTTSFRHSLGRQGNRRQSLSSAVAGGTTGGQERPFPQPLSPSLCKWEMAHSQHCPTHPHTGGKAGAGAGGEGEGTHLNKFPGPREPSSHVKIDSGDSRSRSQPPPGEIHSLCSPGNAPILALALNIIRIKTLPTPKHQGWRVTRHRQGPGHLPRPLTLVNSTATSLPQAGDTGKPTRSAFSTPCLTTPPSEWFPSTRRKGKAVANCKNQRWEQDVPA